MYGRTKLGITYNLAYMFMYLIPFIGSIVMLISDGKDRDIKYNAVMSLYMSAAELISIIILSLFGRIPYIGWLFTFALWVVSIFYVGCMLLSMIRAINGKELKVPVIYEITMRTIY
ncbi:MAG: DUF4870 domain-containing protein [Christensenellaceae bacterium]|nr:DUF4870 domain-containing protein [Christensenellaceae bacterium]